MSSTSEQTNGRNLKSTATQPDLLNTKTRPLTLEEDLLSGACLVHPLEG